MVPLVVPVVRVLQLTLMFSELQVMSQVMAIFVRVL